MMTRPTVLPGFLSSAQGSALIGISKGTLNGWASDGRVPHIVDANGCFQFRPDDLLRVEFRPAPPKLPILERFLLRVDKSDGCWSWTGRLDRNGYGSFDVNRRQVGAHRWSYEQFIGPIPSGLDIDHVCHSRVAETCLIPKACMHRRCVNPAHLEPVTRRENLLRGNTLRALREGRNRLRTQKAR